MISKATWGFLLVEIQKVQNFESGVMDPLQDGLQANGYANKYTWSTYKKAENTWAYTWGDVTPTNGDSGVYGPLQNELVTRPSL